MGMLGIEKIDISHTFFEHRYLTYFISREPFPDCIFRS